MYCTNAQMFPNPSSWPWKLTILAKKGASQKDKKLNEQPPQNKKKTNQNHLLDEEAPYSIHTYISSVILLTPTPAQVKKDSPLWENAYLLSWGNVLKG